MESNNPYNELLHKFLDGTIAERESHDLFTWLNENAPGSIPELESTLKNTYCESFANTPKIIPSASDRILQKLMTSIGKRSKKRPCLIGAIFYSQY